ncbi:tRNA pseudouridine(38-40) synthase TruA [Lacticaseibacillus saniviri]|uniref:tRNA pseudouridine(38-40) synthase TruA n=1 Tax=Lacticaseibacillus saniviri TaxID=931533 RepID=UPI000704F40C|nr:tRNA pseudouridine(38-40) synthase TruA [Lacticaseibacillus saniviri]MCG4282287.1 tRNA pseudouridine(38-40) synthase TruA [Lacticaseibacillus saniviri]
MTTYRVTLAYDGTNFAGYQVQPKQRTVQGVLEKALTKMTKGTHVHVDGSGRTDSGVHALGQVISFDYPGMIPAPSMLRALNSLMPLDIEILNAEIVPEAFHARYSAVGKRYMYKVARGRYTDPFKRLYTGHYPYPLDVDKIKIALKDLEGTHDFTSFAASGGVIVDKVRTIYEATVTEDQANNELTFEFYGNGFLYNMVRILVATALEIGNGRRDQHDFLRLFEVKDRQQARGTAPASGLYLKEVYYPSLDEIAKETRKSH